MKGLQATKKVRSYEKGTRLRKCLKLRKRYEEVTKSLGYEVTKLRDSNATYRDNLLWRIVMHYGKMPRATLGSSDLRSHSVGTCTTAKKKHRACAKHENDPPGRILRNFRLYMRRTYFRTRHVIDVTSGHVTSGSTIANTNLSVPIYY
jgi:hypothetical protein